MSARIAFQGLPKQLSKQLNQIKRDKEQEDKLHPHSKADKVGKLQSDIISNNERGGNSSDEEEKGQRWEKVKLPGITKAIRKVNVKREQFSGQDTNEDGQWTKNCDINDSFSYENNTTGKSIEDNRPKKKITINRDNKGRAHFKEEIIDQESTKNKQQVQQSRSLVVKRPVIQLKNRKQQEQDEQMEEEYENDSKSEYSRSDNGNQDEDDDAEYERQKNNNKKQQNYDNEDNNDRYDEDSLDQEYEVAQQKQHETSRGKYGYLEVSNLPKQIDNLFLKDLLKREKDHLIESYKTDNKGRVKLDSKEAAERSITILNKRTLYGQTIQAYIINEAQFNRSSGTTKSKIPVIQRITTKRSR